MQNLSQKFKGLNATVLNISTALYLRVRVGMMSDGYGQGYEHWFDDNIYYDYCYEDYVQYPALKRQRLSPAENENAETSHKQEPASGNKHYSGLAKRR